MTPTGRQSTPSPTPTAGPPSPSSAPPTATPTRTTTAVPIRPLYLPFTSRYRCQPTSRPVDIALILDTSSSMTGDKLLAAQRAASTFANLLNLRPDRDRAAVIGFDATARLAQPLTASRAALQGALASLSPSPGTRIDLGLAAATDELTGPRRRPEADRALVLLTDGLPQGGTEAETIAQGDRARAAGIATWVVGLGADVQPALLARIAGGADHVRLAPDAADLEEIYRQIASGIVCR